MYLSDNEYRLIEQLRNHRDVKLHSIAHLLNIPYDRFVRQYRKWRQKTKEVSQ